MRHNEKTSPVHIFLFPQGKPQGKQKRERITDRLRPEDSVDSQNEGQKVNKRNQKNNLAQSRNDDGRQWFSQGLKEGGRQHDKSQRRSDDKIDAQA